MEPDPRTKVKLKEAFISARTNSTPIDKRDMGLLRWGDMPNTPLKA